MMDNIKELEIQLENAKKLQKESEKVSILNENLGWVGKCFSTHLFQRVPAPHKELILRKVTDVTYEHDKLRFVGTNITFMLRQSDKRFHVDISKAVYDNPYPHWVGSFCHEISTDLFDRILAQTEAHGETYFDMVRGLFKQNELISSGDKDREEGKVKWLENEAFIELPTLGFPSIKDILVGNNHPYIYDYNKLLYTESSIEIVKKIADTIEKNMYSWGGAIYQRDKVRVDALRAFYKKYKL